LSTSGNFKIPSDGTYEETLEFIRNMPDETAEVFGLHDNVTITKELQETKLIFDSILLTTDTSKAFKADAELAENVADILGKLPQDFDLQKANEKYPVQYESSMNTVLITEMERFNK
jgi:dynein heavy chain